MKILLLSPRSTDEVGDTFSIDVLPETALLRSNYPLFVPHFGADWHLRISIGIRIERLGKTIASRFASRYYSQFLLGLRLVQGKEVDIPTGFDDSMMTGMFDTLPCRLQMCESPLRHAEESRGDDEVLLEFNPGVSSNEIDSAIEEVSRYFVLHTGDLVMLETGLSMVCPGPDRWLKVLYPDGRTILNHKIK